METSDSEKLKALLLSKQRENRWLALNLINQLGLPDDLFKIFAKDKKALFLPEPDKLKKLFANSKNSGISQGYLYCPRFRIYNLEKDYPKILDLSSHAYNAIPESVGYMESVEQLNLANNRIKKFSFSGANLQKITHLNLQNNQLWQLDPELYKLKNLAVLILHKNRLKSIPLELNLWAKLRELNLSENNIKGSVVNISHHRLEVVHLAKNQIEECIGFLTLPRLNSLYLQHNQISKVSDNISKIKHLWHLSLAYNRLKELPLLPNLSILHLQNNQLTKFPIFKTEASSLVLRELNLTRNPIEEVPKELSEWKNLQVLRLGNSHISQLPDMQKTSLRVLYLDYTKVERFEDWFEQLPKSLQMIQLRGTPLSRNKKEMQKLRKLMKERKVRLKC